MPAPAGPEQEKSRMKPIMISAIALAAALSAAPVAAQEYGQNLSSTASKTVSGDVKGKEAPAAKGAITPSKGALPAIADLQKAVLANDTANIPAKIAAAQAVATTKEDHYLIGQAQLTVALKAKNNDAMASAIDTIATTGLIDAAKLSDIYTGLGVEFYNAKQFDRAAAEFQRASGYVPGNSDPLTLLAEAQFSQGKPADGAATLSKVLLMSSAAGHKAEEKVYRRAVAMAYQAKQPSAVQLSRDWLVAYPGADSWRNALGIYRNSNNLGIGPTLDLLRLMRVTGAMTNAADYNFYATVAVGQNNFGEAQSVIDQGVAAKLVDPASADFKEVVTTLKTKPVATEDALLAAAKTAPAGSTLVGIGDRMYGLGQYATAADIYRRALAKGADKDLANLHLGMALARAGDKAGATAALKAAGGPQADIARYWLLYVQTMA
jgi:tetratricopeptide (TPR) repeat protein